MAGNRRGQQGPKAVVIKDGALKNVNEIKINSYFI